MSATLLSLPAELRMAILNYTFEETEPAIYTPSTYTSNIGHLNETYKASTHLAPLLACRQLHADAHLLAFRRTTFLTTNLFASIPDRLAILPAPQLASLRHIAFTADARHFRQLQSWGTFPFGLEALQLDTLTIALHRSSFWHYLFDYTAALVAVLRELRGVRRLVFVRNGALVKGSFRSWCNRLVGLMMKVDHAERFEPGPGDGVAPRRESTWWEWRYDEFAQIFEMRALPPKPWMEEEEYMLEILPIMESLRLSIESEEWNPDPRSRRLYP